MGPLGTAGLVVALVIFMLLERRDLRDRLIGLIGHGRLTVTTKAFDEAGSRVSKQLLMQSLVNGIYGLVAGVGLYFLGVPYRAGVGHARRGASLRSVSGSRARRRRADPRQPGRAAGLDRSAVGGRRCSSCSSCSPTWCSRPCCTRAPPACRKWRCSISVAFWTWLWGPLGLLMATPLTVCLVVLGKHVPGLAFVGTLMADTPPLAPEYGYYQRLLARDPERGGRSDRDATSRTSRGERVYDALLLPALNYAERDRLENRLSPEEEAAVIEATRELLTDTRRLDPCSQPPSDEARAGSSERSRTVPAHHCACWATPPTAPPTSSPWRCSRRR